MRGKLPQNITDQSNGRTGDDGNAQAAHIAFHILDQRRNGAVETIRSEEDGRGGNNQRIIERHRHEILHAGFREHDEHHHAQGDKHHEKEQAVKAIHHFGANDDE